LEEVVQQSFQLATKRTLIDLPANLPGFTGRLCGLDFCFVASLFFQYSKATTPHRIHRPQVGYMKAVAVRVAARRSSSP
jgi:hypothetical protein